MAMATKVFALSLTAIPVTYSVNFLLDSRGEGWFFAAGYGVLGSLALASYLIARYSGGSQKVTDPFFYGKKRTLIEFPTPYEMVWGLGGQGQP